MASFFSAWNLSFYTSIRNRWQMDLKMGHGGFCVICHLCQGWEMCIHGDPPSGAYHVISSWWYWFVKTEGFEFSGLAHSVTAMGRRLIRGLWAELEIQHPYWKGEVILRIMDLPPKDHRTRVLRARSFPLLLVVLLALGHSWRWKQNHRNFQWALGRIHQRETFCSLHRPRSNLVTRKRVINKISPAQYSTVFHSTDAVLLVTPKFKSYLAKQDDDCSEFLGGVLDCIYCSQSLHRCSNTDGTLD